MKYSTTNLDEFREVVRTIYSSLEPAKSATVLALKGELGAGKTTFVQNLAKEFGITETLTSPTFVIQKRYEILQKDTPFNQLIHIDAYRLSSAEELEKLDWATLVIEPTDIICIEWPENVQKLIPENAIYIEFAIEDDNSHTVTYDSKE